MRLAPGAVRVMNFVAVEVGGRMLSACFGSVARVRHWTMVSVIGMEVIVYVAVEVGGAVKPGAGSDKGAAGEPLGTVVPVGRASIGSGFVVAVGAVRSCSDADANLGLRRFG